MTTSGERKPSITVAYGDVAKRVGELLRASGCDDMSTADVGATAVGQLFGRLMTVWLASGNANRLVLALSGMANGILTGLAATGKYREVAVSAPDDEAN